MLGKVVKVVGLGAVGFMGYRLYDASSTPNPSFSSGFLLARFYQRFGFLRSIVDPETAHDMAVKVAEQNRTVRACLGIVDDVGDASELKSQVWGMEFKNPVGLGAGFDKHAEAIDGLLDMGFGFVEIGTVTPLPQPGNPQPRIFRLAEDEALINRYGFNSEGAEAVGFRLASHHLGQRKGVLGVNLGKNKNQEDAAKDYVACVQKLGRYSDYVVVNVSSPNTPGLRALQSRQALHDLLSQVRVALKEVCAQTGKGVPAKRCPPLLVKIAPDLTEEDKKDIADVCLTVGVDGLVVTNTTIERPASLTGRHKTETGGLSGAPLRERSTAVIRDMYRLTNGRLPIIGVGGVMSGKDAYEKIRAGASLVQVYTSFVYEGPAVVRRIKDELTTQLREDGYRSVSEAVGAEHRSKASRTN